MRNLALVFLLLAACATAGEPGVPDFATSAKENFDLGVQAMKDENWQEASQYFEHVRTKYPYSSFAAESELRLADTLFSQGHYTDAIDAYKNFIKFRPGHTGVDWASFRIGESHYKAIPSDFFLFPPSTQKDQTQVRAARDSLKDFLLSYPGSTYEKQARELLVDVMKRLAEHEDAVGTFYARRDEWPGVALRYEYLLANYPDSELVPHAAEQIVQAYKHMGEASKARASLEKFLKDHPGHPQAARIQAVMKDIG
jgi:outer membrane protein assembly factor BamD